MSKGLRKNERCPIHHRYDCCGREASKQMPRRNPIKGPVTRIEDKHHPRGYIEVCSTAEKRRRKMIKIREQKGMCALCPHPLEDVRDVELDHKRPAPAGCPKDDHMDNIQAAHRLCNQEKGSKRIFRKTEEV